MFELKNRFRHLTMIEPKKQNIVRQIYICLTEKYNGFQTISIEFAGRERKNFKPIDIIYGPTKNTEIRPLCYYTNIFQKHIQIFMTKKVKQKELIVAMNAIIADLFLKKDRHKRHIENCAGVRGVVYNFNTKSLIRFQDKFHAKDDLPFV